MIFLAHLRLRRRIALLASGVLEGREREETRAHAERCARCRTELEEVGALLAAIERDPVRDAEMELPLPVLVSRVEREVDRALLSPGGRPRLWLVAAPAAAAVLAALALLPRAVERVRPQAAVSPSTATHAPAVSTDALDRIERTLAREHAARYLSEAGNVLVAVAASPPDCERSTDGVDMGEAPARSRALLARRALAVEADREAVALARAVLDDVELTLREVADLPACVRRRDLERLRREVESRQLLMRIRLTTRELEG